MLNIAELLTKISISMDCRFETLWQLGILPGLANVAGKHHSLYWKHQ